MTLFVITKFLPTPAIPLFVTIAILRLANYVPGRCLFVYAWGIYHDYCPNNQRCILIVHRGMCLVLILPGQVCTVFVHTEL